MHTGNPVIRSLEHAMRPIIDEMFQNGPEEACRIWEDYSHPLQQAIQILMKAQVSVFSETPEALALREILKQGEPPASLFGKPRVISLED